MTNRKYVEPSAGAMTIKSIVLAGLVGVLLMFMVYTISFVSEESSYANDKAWIMDRCNEYYYEKEYGQLYDYMVLYDLCDDDDFAMHQEMLEGYLDYRQYEMWAAVPDGQIEGSESKVEYYRERIQENVTECKYDANLSQLKLYASMSEE